MKRMTTLLITAVLFLMMIVPIHALAMTWNAYVQTANGKGLYLRTGPTKDASVQTSIPYGAQLVILGEYDDGTWITVSYNGYDGYVMKRYLTYDKPGPAPTPKPAPKPGPKPAPNPNPDSSIAAVFSGFSYTYYTVSVRPSTPGGIVHLRWAPTKQAGIMTDFHQGDVLEVLAQNKQWAQVRNPETGLTGFMMRSFLSDVADGASKPQNAPADDSNS